MNKLVKTYYNCNFSRQSTISSNYIQPFKSFSFTFLLHLSFLLNRNTSEVNFVLFQSPKILIFHVGIPIGVNTSNIKLAREFDLPRRTRINDWQVMRDGGKNRSRKLMALPYTTNTLSITGPEQVTVSNHSWQTLN